MLQQTGKDVDDSYQSAEEANFSYELVTSVVDDPQTPLSLCAEWAFERVFVEILLGVILLLNLFSVYIVLSSPPPKRASSFMSNCIKLINISNCLLILHLLCYPFVFSWSHLIIISDEEEDTDDDASNVSANILRQYWTAKEAHIGNDIHPCQQMGRVTCKISGFLFGLFLYIPLASLSVMTIDTTLCAFRWKMHRFRPHTVSTMRLTLLLGFLFAITTSFGLPSFAIGTHYHYSQFLKICWLSVDEHDLIVQEFAYFIFGFGCFLLLLIIIFGYMVLQAYRSEKCAVNETIGHQCNLLIGQYTIVKSRVWVSYARLVLWMNAVAIVSYLPTTVGYLVRYALLLSDIQWLNLVLEASVLVFPTISPFLLVCLCKPHIQRTKSIFHKCFGSSNTNKQVSPLLRSESAWSERSCAFSDVDTFGYRDMIYGRKGLQNKPNGRENYGFQRQHIDRLREVYPSQYAFSQIPTSPYSTMYSDFQDGQLDQNTPTIPRNHFDMLPRQLALDDSSNAQLERQRRFYDEPILKREDLVSRFVRPAISQGQKQSFTKYQRPQFHMPQFGLFHDGNVIKSSQVPLPRRSTNKWKISDSFYSEELHGKPQANNNQFSQKIENSPLGNDITFAERFEQYESPWNSRQNQTSTLNTIDSDTEQSNNQKPRFTDHTVQSSNYSYDVMNDQDGTYGKAFQPNFSYRFKRHPGK